MKISPSFKAISSLSMASFFLYFGYELVRSPSNVMFQAAYGVQNLSLALSFTPVGVILMLVIYDFMLDKLGPRWTLTATTLLSTVLLLACGFLIENGVNFARVILLIFGQAYIVLLGEQYWSYLDSVQSESHAKRWNSIFSGVGGLGAITGGYFVGQWAKSIGTTHLSAYAALLLLPAAFLGHLSYGFLDVREKVSGKHGVLSTLGLKDFKTSPILFRILFIILASQAISTVFGLEFQSEMQKAFGGDVDGQTAYSGRFYGQLSLISTLAQFFITPLILRWVPLGFVFVAIPIVHAVNGLNLLLNPSLATASIAFMVFKSVDYSFFRASKELLYIPLSFDARYRAKELIDSFGYRMSKGVISGGIAVLQSLGLAGGALNPAVGLVSAAGWVMLTFPFVRRRNTRQMSHS